jgi:thiol-disulfide isomerase/thioredoxin
MVPTPSVPMASSAPLRLTTLDGASAELTRAPGKVLFVNFWATWCPPCRAEIPDFVAFWQAADQSRVAIQAVDLTTTEKDLALVAPFVREQRMVFPILMDTSGLAAAKYQIESIPTTLVFDPAGKLVHRQVGVMTKDQMERLVSFYGNP